MKINFILGIILALAIIGSSAVVYAQTAIAPLTQTTYNLNSGDRMSVHLRGTGTYYVSNNSNPDSINVFIANNELTVSATKKGDASFSICNTKIINRNCFPVTITVDKYVTSTPDVTSVTHSVDVPYTSVNSSAIPDGAISLSQVPYTGIGSNAKVFLFILALATWSGAIAYFIVREKALSQKV